jgi:N-acetylglucosaminyl-diphospho-decaprenol L-rhamnosyltransferase
VAGTVVRRTPLRLVLPRGTASSRHHLAPPTAPRIIDWALGACLLVRRTAWHEIGGFDGGFRLYVEDIDLAWRAWDAGWEVWQTPAARAAHEHQAVIDRVFLSRRTLWHLAGMVRFVRKHPAVLAGRRPRATGKAAPERAAGARR